MGLVRDSGVSRLGRVILAEDDDDLRHLFARELRAASLEVVEARSGAELLDRLALALAESPDFSSIDLVVSDIYMPGYNGVEVMTGLLAAESWKPFVLMTAFASSALRKEALDRGAVAVLEKPIAPALLRKVVVTTLSMPARRSRVA